MELFLAALIVFGLALLGMAVGAIVKGKCLKGTCGGLNQMRDSSGRPICEACAPSKVRELIKERANAKH